MTNIDFLHLPLTEKCGCCHESEINTKRKTMWKGSRHKKNNRYKLKPFYAKLDKKSTTDLLTGPTTKISLWYTPLQQYGKPMFKRWEVQ